VKSFGVKLANASGPLAVMVAGGYCSRVSNSRVGAVLRLISSLSDWRA
jgi:hypothetical protein